tara:strand:- start:872 stop:1489 length:618 start_codon:yes stop_codon:yes gene_type:complete
LSKVQVDTIDTRSGTSTMQIGSTNTTTINLGVSGDTINIPSGVTIANAGTATGFGGANTPAWAVTMNGNQSGLSQNAHTLVEMDTELLDTDNAYTNTASNYKFTVPSGKAGTYVIGALLYCNTQTVSQFRVQIYKNGSRIGRMNVNDSSNPDYPSAMINIVDVASAGDYYQCYCYHNQSGGITLYGGDGTNAIHTHGFFGYRLIS